MSRRTLKYLKRRWTPQNCGKSPLVRCIWTVDDLFNSLTPRGCLSHHSLQPKNFIALFYELKHLFFTMFFKFHWNRKLSKSRDYLESVLLPCVSMSSGQTEFPVFLWRQLSLCYLHPMYFLVRSSLFLNYWIWILKDYYLWSLDANKHILTTSRLLWLLVTVETAELPQLHNKDEIGKCATRILMPDLLI